LFERERAVALSHGLISKTEILPLFKAPVSRQTSPKIINRDAAISLFGKFSIIAVYFGDIWLSIKLEQSKLARSKTGSQVSQAWRYIPAESRFLAATSWRRHISVLPLT
jgi:hypothetical protein